MKKELYGSAVLPLDGDPQVTYSLLCDETGSRLGVELYGVQVSLGGETVSLPRLTASKKSAGALLDKLIAGSVTPVGVNDVVSDWTEAAGRDGCAMQMTFSL